MPAIYFLPQQRTERLVLQSLGLEHDAPLLRAVPSRPGDSR